MKLIYNIAFFLIYLPIMAFTFIGPFLPLMISHRSNWWEAKIFISIFMMSFIISRLSESPDLVVERARFLLHENAKAWDKLLAPLVAISCGFVPLVVGIDSLFNWSPTFGLTAKIISLLFIITGLTLVTYALIKNRFFSSIVRIQVDRGHQVISRGPYRWIRHPGYAGLLLTYIAVPFFLDSIWAIVPATFFTILLVIRTAMEDRTLQDELDGYSEYAKIVHYRLFPGVW